RRLESLARDPYERDRRKGEAATCHQRAGHLRAQVSTERPRLLAHPEDHPGDDARREQHRRAFVERLRVPVELTDGSKEDCADDHARHDRGSDAEPDCSHMLAIAGLVEDAEDEAHEQSSLEALAENDYE